MNFIKRIPFALVLFSLFACQPAERVLEAAKAKEGEVEIGDKNFQEKIAGMMRAGEDLNRYKNSNTSPLFLAVSNGYNGSAELLLRNKAKMTPEEGSDMEPLHYAAFAPHGDRALKIVQLLIEHGADVRSRTKITKETALHKAAGRGRPEIVKFLIDKGVDVDAQDFIGQTALHKAALMGFKGVAEVLVQNGAKSLKDMTGKTPLQTAIDASGDPKQLESQKILIRSFGDVQSDYHGLIALLEKKYGN